jgi:hypothetical protein
VSRFLDAFRAGAKQGKGENFGVPCPENPEFPKNSQGAREEIAPPEGFRDFRNIRDRERPEIATPSSVDLAALPDAACSACGNRVWLRRSVLSGGPGPWRCARCDPLPADIWTDATAMVSPLCRFAAASGVVGPSADSPNRKILG